MVSAEGARPLPLLLQSADGRLEALVTPAADGAFELAHLPAGDYYIVLDMLGGGRGTGTVRVNCQP